MVIFNQIQESSSPNIVNISEEARRKEKIHLDISDEALQLTKTLSSPQNATRYNLRSTFRSYHITFSTNSSKTIIAKLAKNDPCPSGKFYWSYATFKLKVACKQMFASFKKLFRAPENY